MDASPEQILQAAKHLASHYQKANKTLPDTLAALVQGLALWTSGGWG